MTQGKVITLKMMVTEMGDRGSKSVIYFFLPPLKGEVVMQHVDRIRLLL